jgi:hypothetical protein
MKAEVESERGFGGNDRTGQILPDLLFLQDRQIGGEQVDCPTYLRNWDLAEGSGRKNSYPYCKHACCDIFARHALPSIVKQLIFRFQESVFSIM